MKMKFKVEGVKEVENLLRKLGKVPQKHVTASARKGMNIAFKASKATVPVDTGQLKKGLKLVGEKARKKGKKVYQVTFNREMNDVFQKRNKAGEINGYYPASMEYGFFAVNGRYIPGYHFLKKSMERDAGKIERTIMSEMKKKIEKEMGN